MRLIWLAATLAAAAWASAPAIAQNNGQNTGQNADRNADQNTGQNLGQTPHTAPLATLKLAPWRTRWVMEAEIAGKTRRYLFDTGAGLSLASFETVKAAGCTPWGRMTGFRMMGDRSDGAKCEGVTVGISGISRTPAVFGLIDMGKLNPKDAELDGVFGLNLFENDTITIDFAAGILTVESERSRAARIAGMQPLPIRLKREVDGLALAAIVAVPVKEGTLWMEMDSGNGGTILVSKPVAAMVGMDPAAEGKQRADFAVAGDIRATSDDAFSPDMIIDGNLGMPFLRNWVVTLDLKQGLAWLGKPPVPPAPAQPLPPQ
ncbi:MAG: hypothetical protein EOP62_20425 [Sphingomonadales bacterium]|nr:MAG: hypothetical protein EOP62_20425 [Sphingomonadales bacterium]